MERLPASQKMRKECEEIISGGKLTEFLLNEVIKKGAGIILQEMLGAEMTDFLGRKHYESQTEEESNGYRNGYEPSKVKTAEGNICVYALMKKCGLTVSKETKKNLKERPLRPKPKTEHPKQYWGQA